MSDDTYVNVPAEEVERVLTVIAGFPERVVARADGTFPLPCKWWRRLREIARAIEEAGEEKQQRTLLTLFSGAGGVAAPVTAGPAPAPFTHSAGAIEPPPVGCRDRCRVRLRVQVTA